MFVLILLSLATCLTIKHSSLRTLFGDFSKISFSNLIPIWIIRFKSGGFGWFWLASRRFPILTRITSVPKYEKEAKCASHIQKNSQIEYQPHALLNLHSSLPAAQRSRLLVEGLENQLLNLTGCIRSLLLTLLLLLLLLLHLLHHLPRPTHTHLLLEVRCHFESGRGSATLLQRGGPTRKAREPAFVVNMEWHNQSVEDA
jgi:hypothetical protein